MMELEWDYASECIINDVVIEKLKGYQEVIIFGAGDSGSWAHGLLKRHGLKIKAFCDNCKKLWGRVKHGISIESFDNAVKKIPTGCYMHCVHVGRGDIGANQRMQS